MTRATFVRKDGLLCGFTLRGHAGAGVSGTDVVCAAISSAAYLAANTITEICRCRPIPRRGTGFSGCRWRNRPAVRIFSWG